MIMTNDNQTPPTEPQANLDLPNEEVKLSKLEFDKLNQQLNNYKTKFAEMDATLKNKQIQDAKAVQDWQKVAELKEAEATDANEKLNKFKTAFIQDKKMTAVREAAIKAGVVDQAINDLGSIDDFSDVVLTENNGNIQVSGVDRAMQRLKATRGYLFNKPLPSLNPNTPTAISPMGSAVTLDQIKKAETNFRSTGKGGEELKSLYAQWSQQQRKA